MDRDDFAFAHLFTLQYHETLMITAARLKSNFNVLPRDVLSQHYNFWHRYKVRTIKENDFRLLCQQSARGDEAETSILLFQQ